MEPEKDELPADCVSASACVRTRGRSRSLSGGFRRRLWPFRCFRLTTSSFLRSRSDFCAHVATETQCFPTRGPLGGPLSMGPFLTVCGRTQPASVVLPDSPSVSAFTRSSVPVLIIQLCCRRCVLEIAQKRLYGICCAALARLSPMIMRHCNLQGSRSAWALLQWVCAAGAAREGRLFSRGVCGQEDDWQGQEGRGEVKRADCWRRDECERTHRRFKSAPLASTPGAVESQPVIPPYVLIETCPAQQMALRGCSYRLGSRSSACSRSREGSRRPEQFLGKGAD